MVRATAAFPTGNGKLTRDPDGVVVIDRDLRDSTGDRWYWHVELQADERTTATVRMARPGLLGRFGPAVGTRGEGYRWLESRLGSPATEFTFSLPAGVPVRVSATLPYGPSHLQRFTTRTASRIHWGLLTRSERGGPVAALRAGAGDSSCLLVVTARHHACEALGSYLLEGVVDRFLELLAVDSGAVRCDLLAVPMMDVDGVAAGDQGKGRQPRDHNRDYGLNSRFSAVRALQDLLAGERRLVAGLDLHTPGLVGALEERCYVTASADLGDLDTAVSVAEALDRREVDTLVFDGPWNSADSVAGMGMTAWLRSQPGTAAALTIEYPNAVLADRPVTADRARAFGGRLLDALLTVVR